MTDREKLIELMRQVDACICNLCDSEEESFNHSAGVLADHLLANGVTFATDNHVGGKWIPVTERLPRGENGMDLSDLVVAYTKDGEVTTGWINGNGWWVVCGERDYFERRDRGYVTHWMPLPEPPADMRKGENG